MSETTCSYPEEMLHATASGWGWTNPPRRILAIAEQCLVAKQMESENYLVKIGAITATQMNRWLNAKPANISRLAWFAEQDSTVAPFMDKVQALKAGYPFYETLADMSIHSCMTDAQVSKRADELDAAVMLIEEKRAVVVFSNFTSLIKFSTMGRGARDDDAILKVVGENVLIGVGARDQISAVLTNVRADDDSMGATESATVWTATTESQNLPEIRELVRLIDHAITQNATDIALMPLRTGELVVQMRKNGDMISPIAVSGRVTAEVGLKMVSFLKSKSGANPTGTVQRTPTDGQITYRSGSQDCFLRLSFIPTNHLGERRNLTSVSIRLLSRAETNISLHDLQIEQAVIDQIRFAMRMSQGLVLIVGPTNSGKSTTIAGAIGLHVDIFGDSRKRLSVEDPIERYLNGIVQVNVPNFVQDEEARFRVILRALKRHDPDMIWLGEIRDKNSAVMCVESASTGHLVLSTLHATDTVMAFDVLAKTVDAEIRFQLIESMSLVMSQRLIKALCNHCKVISPPTHDEVETFKKHNEMLGTVSELPASVGHAHPDGCEHCSGGYNGLLPIYEVLPFSRKVKDAAIRMLGGESSRADIAAARTVTLLDSGLKLIKEHRVDLDAILV